MTFVEYVLALYAGGALHAGMIHVAYGGARVKVMPLLMSMIFWFPMVVALGLNHVRRSGGAAEPEPGRQPLPLPVVPLPRSKASVVAEILWSAGVLALGLHAGTLLVRAEPPFYAVTGFAVVSGVVMMIWSRRAGALAERASIARTIQAIEAQAAKARADAGDRST